MREGGREGGREGVSECNLEVVIYDVHFSMKEIRM